ncbi:MAG: D-alanyl-D-alanine carboxypeptidase [Paracoccus sp. (in: a-proteobacteria)]|uniref:D-alanyl-D-alanine carboxypeptidase/D-alanyl-D-alanine-endopeptidase n=1 Tax=Paracoccus sp. TaxID=267 RepID=UPI0026DEE167|nr:D-alanyl-D-alanine carboxypeptidase [Paracoccus sp. (in: a-proteobacteria)]MDO5622059.1 D-alanyl-D-alanine carboxypeptidase [Paracoccus sp. (in: a-proteobacteria)]
MTEPRISRRFLLAGGLGFALARPGLAQEAAGLLASQRPAIAPAPDPEALVQAARLGGVVSFQAMDAASGRIVAQRAPDLPLPPASTLKVLTALYALDRLGPDYRFRTRILRRGDDLILAGGGDPVLDTDQLAELAKRTAAAQPQGVTRLLVWGGALPARAVISAEQEDALAYNPAISGLNLNFNRVHLSWRCASDCQLSFEARARRHSPRAYTVRGQMVAGGGRIRLNQQPQGDMWQVPRNALDRQGARWLPVRTPELYAGDVFQTLCRAEGLALPAPEVTAEAQGDEIAVIDSPPLREILAGMLDYSTNLTAEVVGLTASGAGDLPASARMMQDWAAGQGVQGVICADHSGLSAQNQVTAAAMVQLLAGPGRGQDIAALLKSGPVWPDAGDGWTGQMRAKTGTLNFVSNLVGYAGAGGADGVIFAIFCADQLRRAENEGRELPPGVISWTNRAKALQQDLIDGWSRETMRQDRNSERLPLPPDAG